MKHSVLFYNSGTNKTSFELESGMRPWGILMLITAGRYTLELPERKQSYTFAANTISYIPPNTLFIRKIEEPISFHQFHIQLEPNTFLTENIISSLTITEEKVRALDRSLRYTRNATCTPELLEYIVEHIFMENYLFSSQYLTPKYSEDISCVLHYMQEHLAENFNLNKMAKIANLSPTGLIWKFHQQLNTTPQQHFINLRMQLAKQLLVETLLPITQVAEKCGYNDVYYFSNAFRKNTGVSPSAFRKFPKI